MAIEVTCVCGERFRVADQAVGQRTGCTACGRELVVPKGPYLPGDSMSYAPEATSGKAIASLVLGILAFFCNVFTGLPAVILGAIGLSDIGRSQGRLGGKGLAIAGIVTGCVGTLLVVPVLIALLLPAVQAAREAARRAQCTNNLKQIALGFHNLHEKDGHFPPAAILDPQGKPLLSWRVTILPYIDQEGLYRQFKLDEPWDSPSNRALLAQMPATFACPSDPPGGPGMTHYQGIVGAGALFDKPEGTALTDITDGTSNTLLVVEGTQPVPWTKPDDVDLATIATALGSRHPGGANAAFADGSVKFLKKSISPSLLKSLGTRAGGEVVLGGSY